MFILKQFLKALLLPPMPWLLMLLAVLIFWQRRWARKLLFVTFLLILASPLRPGKLRAALPTRVALSAAARSAQSRPLRRHRGAHRRQLAGDRLDPVSIRRRAYVSPPRRGLAALSHPAQTDHYLRRPCQSVHPGDGRKQDRPRLSHQVGRAQAGCHRRGKIPRHF